MDKIIYNESKMLDLNLASCDSHLKKNRIKYVYLIKI